MNLPKSKAKELYAAEIRVIESSLKAATADQQDDHLLSLAQKRLDKLAEKYQYDEEVGVSRYKLYELQALIHYFGGNDQDAIRFINVAVETRGESYARAEKLKQQLKTSDFSDNESAIPKNMTKQESRKQLIGLEGWLALFIVGQIFALLITIFNLFKDGLFLSSSDVDLYNQYQSGLGDTLQALTNFENISLIVAAGLISTTLTLLFRKKKLAKAFAITTILFLAVYSVIDYAVVSSIFESANLTQYDDVSIVISEAAGNTGRNIIAAAIWIPYFLISKRVKRTLTK